MQKYFELIAAYLWKESVKNLNSKLSDVENLRFTANDYYYISVIHCLVSPTPSEVALYLYITKPAITVFIKRMIKLDLLEKKISKTDKRIYHILLTSKARSIVEYDKEVLNTLVQNLEKSMSLEEVISVNKALEIVTNRLK